MSKGGYQILDLTGLDLEVKTLQTSITNEKVLKQLDYLKEYIEDGYNYAKPLNNKLKPILLRFRDKKTNEKLESSVWANVRKKTDNLHFVIDAVISSELKTIQIEVIFELKQDEADNYYYGIKTAKYLLSKSVTIEGDTLLDGDADISGDASVGGTLSVTGNATLPIINNEENPSVKPIYWHTIKFQRGGNSTYPDYSRLVGYMIILNNSPTPITLNDFQTLLATQGFVGVLINALCGSPKADLTDMNLALRIENDSATGFNVIYRDPTTNSESTLAGYTVTTGWASFQDLGVNKIN